MKTKMRFSVPARQKANRDEWRQLRIVSLLVFGGISVLLLFGALIQTVITAS